MRLTLLISLLISSISLGQNEATKESSHSIGLNANTISGVGPSYRFSYKGFSTQATISGYMIGSRTKYNVGVSIMHRFDRLKKGQINFGLSCRFKQLGDEAFEPEGEKLVLKKKWSEQLNTGIHFDYMRMFGKKIQLNLSLGYGIYNVFGSVTRSTDYNYYPQNLVERIVNFKLKNLGTFPTAGIALYYRLN